jgi:hypothetical protein
MLLSEHAKKLYKDCDLLLVVAMKRKSTDYVHVVTLVPPYAIASARATARAVTLGCIKV